MPNHVINSITVSGEETVIDEMLESIKNREAPFEVIDFNRIIPMPESLGIEASSDTDRGLQAYKDFIYVYTLAGTRKDADLDNIPEESEKVFLKARKDISSRQWELGKAAYANLNKYGAPTWYEWSIGNWGTKWNAYDSFALDRIGDAAIFGFQTAWSAPHPILERLSEMYPSIEFKHAWADEDIGSNCGRREYRDGHLADEYCPDGDEAIAFASEMWGLEPDEDEAEETAETEETENSELKM